MSERSFGVLILSHGRPEKVMTLRTLRLSGYTGRAWVVVDDEDPTVEGYRQEFGADWVVQFGKADIAKTFDQGDLSGDRRTIVYARRAAWDIARGLGLTHFVELDDDYSHWSYRRPGVPDSTIRSLDRVFDAMLDLLEDTGALTVAFSQGGDHLGGKSSAMWQQGYGRKAMNSFFVRTSRPVDFVGRLNEDVNAYCVLGSRGELFLTVPHVYLNQTPTQQTQGGMTEAYLSIGTYTKSFYTVMMAPSFVSIAAMGQTDKRLHHRIAWGNAVPKIVAPEVRKD